MLWKGAIKSFIVLLHAPPLLETLIEWIILVFTTYQNLFRFVMKCSSISAGPWGSLFSWIWQIVFQVSMANRTDVFFLYFSFLFWQVLFALSINIKERWTSTAFKFFQNFQYCLFTTYWVIFMAFFRITVYCSFSWKAVFIFYFLFRHVS